MKVLERVKLKLGILDDTKDNLLKELILEAEQRLRLFLNYKEEDSVEPFTATLINIVVALYRIDKINEKEEQVAKNVKSESYSEGSVSQSVTYITSSDYQQQIKEQEEQVEKYLEKLARYRKVYVKSRN